VTENKKILICDGILLACVPLFADHEDARIIGEAYANHRCDCERCEALPHTIVRGEDDEQKKESGER
jgi:hypothetical protein